MPLRRYKMLMPRRYADFFDSALLQDAVDTSSLLLDAGADAAFRQRSIFTLSAAIRYVAVVFDTLRCFSAATLTPCLPKMLLITLPMRLFSSTLMASLLLIDAIITSFSPIIFAMITISLLSFHDIFASMLSS